MVRVEKLDFQKDDSDQFNWIDKVDYEQPSLDDCFCAVSTYDAIKNCWKKSYEKESSVFEDVSPERGSPDIAGLDDRTHASSRFPTEDSIEGKVLLNTEDVKSQETSGMFLKYGSLFRLIQDYASDESDENVRSDNDEDFNPMSPSLAPTTGTSSLQQDKLSDLCSNFVGQGSVAVANEYVDNTTLCQLLPSIPQGAGRSPDKSHHRTASATSIQ
ncbi:hypothetical protein MA16_Dca004700 [Dendrobium catenatum]|uniref:Uncharacterized protein n=1 Tax=Dendrobium catenatum TaxID=906689 RepID=A0A2I0VNU8_9ASPA|nr:hypothetical protein MA16_Dca004700 [Dendrobium catenatum]